MARASGTEPTLDLRPLIDLVGLKQVIDQMGVQRVVDAIGLQRVVDAVGARRLLGELDWNAVAAQLTPEER